MDLKTHVVVSSDGVSQRISLITCTVQRIRPGWLPTRNTRFDCRCGVGRRRGGRHVRHQLVDGQLLAAFRLQIQARPGWNILKTLMLPTCESKLDQ